MRMGDSVGQLANWLTGGLAREMDAGADVGNLRQKFNARSWSFPSLASWPVSQLSAQHPLR
jgi:hypothetical protein